MPRRTKKATKSRRAVIRWCEPGREFKRRLLPGEKIMRHGGHKMGCNCGPCYLKRSH